MVIVAVSACQSTPPYTPPVEAPQVREAGPQDTLEQANRASGSTAAELYLAAGLAFSSEDMQPQAADALAQVAVDMLPSERHAGFWLLWARITLALRKPSSAEAMLLQASRAPAPDRFAIAELGAQLCMQLEAVDLERYACAIRRLAGFTPTHEQVQPTHDRIWDLLGRSPATLVNIQIAGSSGDAQGWWQLKALMLTGFSVAAQRHQLGQWRRQWPDHPANQQLPGPLRALAQTPPSAQHVALLVPLSGPLARAGRAVRDGFISAHLHSQEVLLPSQDQVLDGATNRATNAEAEVSPGQARLTISVFDSAAEPVPVVLERALLQGADIVVGPLAKQRVEQINALDPLIRVLTLNYLDDHIPPSGNVLQLGLAIEDEADTIVSRLLEDNVQRVLVFHTYKDWSQRAVKRIRQNWPLPLTVQSFTDIRTITESVGEAMDVQASQGRRDELARTLGTDLEFLPRARQDVEAIVALVDTLEATALAPALRFHFAQGVPVYASSQTVRGARPDDLKKLQGFAVSELPWFLSTDSFYQSMDTAFAISSNPFSSLYALGVDAFRVTDRLPLLERGSTHQLLGSTGALSLDQSGRIQRTLAWGIIRESTLAPLSIAPLLITQ
jgi:outer membrane PBP1 activator LpoA protein